MPTAEQYAKMKASDPEGLKRQRREGYERHREKEKADHLAWSRRPEVKERRSKARRERIANSPELKARKTEAMRRYRDENREKFNASRKCSRDRKRSGLLAWAQALWACDYNRELRKQRELEKERHYREMMRVDPEWRSKNCEFARNYREANREKVREAQRAHRHAPEYRARERAQHRELLAVNPGKLVKKGVRKTLRAAFGDIGFPEQLIEAKVAQILVKRAIKTQSAHQRWKRAQTQGEAR